MKDWFDHLLSKVTMYRLVTLSLIALLSLGIVLAALGHLPYSPISIALSSLLLVGVSYLANRLHGWLFDVKPHGESAIITGLILACIMAPATTLVAAVPLILIAVIATASKYILVFRGRHILNPAAVGALFASVTGLGYAIWWIASSALIPLAAIIAFLILYKTRHLMLGVVFIVIATALVTVQYMNLGETAPAAFLIVVKSWPILFFAGVMLSEPLTLPPRRWQQLTVAAIVGVLFGLPIELGVISMTPQLALIIGNIIAFAWGTRRAIRLKLKQKIQLTPSSYEYVFDTVGVAPRYIAGQYMELTVPHKKADQRGQRRMFTIASSPLDHTIRFGIKIPDTHSSFKASLAKLTPNQVITATKTSGDFILPKHPDTPLLWIAGGIGITPFVSFARELSRDKKTRDIVLVYAVSSNKEVAYLDVFKKANIKVIVVTPDSKPLKKGVTQVTAPYITADILSLSVEDIARRRVYVSGPPIMVNHTKKLARKLGARSVKTDYFTGY